MGRGINRLSALGVQKTNKPGYHADGGGLYLVVRPTGAKSWVFIYRADGREKEMGLGPLHTVSLAEARSRALKARLQRLDGGDPLAQKQAAQAASKLASQQALAELITFDECAAEYIKAHREGWKNAKHIAQWEATLATYAAPVFGSKPVGSVTTEHVLEVLRPLWSEKTETATRVRGRIEKILGWAATQGHRTGSNPAAWAGHLEHMLSAPKKTAKTAHHAALPYNEISNFMGKLRPMPGTAALALEFMILTACRTGEVIGARWAEIDVEGKLWTIPTERMKAGKEHVVPLSDAAVALLVRVRGGDAEFVFASKPGKPLSNMACLQLLKRMERTDITAHGFRSTFRDWAGETTDHPREVIEHALAHQLKDKTEAAYQRGTLLEKRRTLMSDWAAFCSKPFSKMTLPADGRT